MNTVSPVFRVQVAVEHAIGELMFNINLLSFSVTDEEVGNLGERWGCFRGYKMTKSYGGFLSGPRFMDDYRMVTLWL